MATKATKANMVDSIINPDHPRANAVMVCENYCNSAHYSANRGDYYAYEDNYQFKCECGSDMILARMIPATIEIIN